MLEPNSARRTIEKFGGISRMASLMRYPKSTVQRWSDSGRIGSDHHAKILETAFKNQIKLEVSDFIDVDLSHPAFQCPETSADVERTVDTDELAAPEQAGAA